MNEDFKFKGGFITNLLDFFKGQLSGQHSPADAHIFDYLYRIAVCKSRLSAGMDNKAGNVFS